MTSPRPAPGAQIIELDEAATALAYPPMKELRPHLGSSAEFVELVHAQRAEGYRLVVLSDSGAVVAAAGFRILRCLAWGRVVYIDDLCTLPEVRGRGHAGALLRWVDDEARRLGCGQVHLDSGTQRHTAHRRYLASGFHIPAFHFAKPVPTSAE